MAAMDEQRLVSVLFADLVGFTSRSHGADPAEIRALQRPFHARVKHEVERRGGRVEKFIGDAVVAVFGADGRRPQRRGASRPRGAADPGDRRGAQRGAAGSRPRRPRRRQLRRRWRSTARTTQPSAPSPATSSTSPGRSRVWRRPAASRSARRPTSGRAHASATRASSPSRCPAVSSPRPCGSPRRAAGGRSAWTGEVDEGPVPGEEVREVTVLFADLLDFSLRSHSADPEEMRALLRPYFGAIRREVDRYGGTVERSSATRSWPSSARPWRAWTTPSARCGQRSASRRRSSS